MSDQHRAPGLDERAAERLLDGAVGPARLRALLSAAAAPGRPEELAGEDAAVAAFRAAPVPERRSRAAMLRRFLTIKVLAVVGGSLILTGGAAYATITGQLPGQSPALSPSPTFDKREGKRGDSTPATRLPPYTPTPGTSPTPSPSSSPSKEHGKAGAPGQQKKSTPPGQQKKTKRPRHTATPPRGPGNNNGNPGKGVTGNAVTSGGGTGQGQPQGPGSEPGYGAPQP
ncbi:hypothetical protein GCM10022254_56860 [Actinomadura meridiana]|uniref:Translation initiation factor IF-2 n=1 Tax=Actinomadura meridiana TaxID=559626 RepID=A0ABP8CGA4_9ACTN